MCIFHKNFVEAPSRFYCKQLQASPALSSGTGFSLCGLICAQPTVHRLKPVLLESSLRRRANYVI